MKDYGSKVVKCTFCHQEFETPVDKLGHKIYSRCEKHRNLTESQANKIRTRELDVCVKNNRKIRSKKDKNVYYLYGQWHWMTINPITLEETIRLSGESEDVFIKAKKLWLAL